MNKGEKRGSLTNVNENEQKIEKRSRESYRKWTKEWEEEQMLLLRMNKGKKRITSTIELRGNTKRSRIEEQHERVKS